MNNPNNQPRRAYSDKNGKLHLPAKYAPFAREMRWKAAEATMNQLWEQLALIDRARVEQYARFGKLRTRTVILQHCIGDEIQRRLLGRYPVDAFVFFG